MNRQPELDVTIVLETIMASKRQSFNKAGQRVSVKRARKSQAQLKFGRMKKVVRVEMAPEDRKIPVCYSVPIWMAQWVKDQAIERGIHDSTFVCALIDSGKAGLEAAEIAAIGNGGMDEIEIEFDNEGIGD